MTKRELHASFTKLAEVGQSPEFRAMLETAREECPFVDSKLADATGIINNEGKLRGWMECVNFLKTVWKAEVEKSKPTPTGLYKDPDPRKQPPRSDINKP